MKKRHLSGKTVYTGIILGLLMILTIGSGLFCNFSTQPSFQSVETSPISLHTAEANAALQWNTTWGGADEDIGYGVAVDANGSIYCAGETNSYGAGDYDFALVKFAPDGTRLWNTTWGSDKGNKGYSVAVDANGSIYCLGYTASFTGLPGNLALVKFAPNGTKLWNITWGGSFSEEGRSVAVDANGSIYCLGSIYSGGADPDLLLVKFTPNGIPLWNTTWGGSDSDYGLGVAVDVNDYIYCTGYTLSFGPGTSALALVKYTPDGEQVWNVTWGSGSAFGYGVMVDASGSVYCTGKSLGDGSYDLALIKFDPNGQQLWNLTWGDVLDDGGRGVAIDASGSLYCSGYRGYGSSGSDLVLLKFSPDGTILWNTRWGGAGDEWVYDMAVDASGSIYCVGETTSSGAGGSDFLLVKLRYTSGQPGEIPGFELVCLLIGLLALLYIAQRRSSCRNTI